MQDDTNPMVSFYPSNYHADALTRIVAKLNKPDFAVSADAPNRMHARMRREGITYLVPGEHLTSVARGVGPWKH